MVSNLVVEIAIYNFDPFHCALIFSRYFNDMSLQIIQRTDAKFPMEDNVRLVVLNRIMQNLSWLSGNIPDNPQIFQPIWNLSRLD